MILSVGDGGRGAMIGRAGARSAGGRAGRAPGRRARGAGYWWVGPTMISPSCESTEAVLAKKRGARSTRVPER